MRKVTRICLISLLMAGMALAQSNYPAPSNTPGQNTPPVTTPTNPTSTPPDQTAPPDANSSATGGISPQSSTTQDNQNQPVLGSRRSEAASSGVGGEVPANTEIKATLDQALSSKDSRVGDHFTATVAQAVRSSDGRTVIPEGAKINGEITNIEEGKTLPALRGKARLNMRFRDLSLPSGDTLPLTATLVSLNQTGRSGQKAGASTNEEGQVSDRTTGREVAKDVGIGAAVGTVGGLIFGSALKGLAIGAVAGGGYAVATQGKNVNLPANTGMVLRLDQSLNVPATTGTR